MTTQDPGSLVRNFAPRVAGGRIRRRTLHQIRWVALGGQAVAVLAVEFWLGFRQPLLLLALLIGFSALVNGLSLLRRPRSRWLEEREASLFLAFDLLQLGGLLALTGGLINPFTFLILAPVTVSASVLSPRSTMALAGLAIAVLALLAFWHLPLPWAGAGFDVEPLYLLGLWIALTLTTAFISAYVASLAAERRRLGEALYATQGALAREQRLAALGGLAAAAAHELGSPLSTIAVVARDLERELPPGSPQREDALLLLEETQRCSRLLAELAKRPEADGGEPFNRLPISALIAAAAEPHRLKSTAHFSITAQPLSGVDETEPVLPRDPQILHGLGTLIQNALQFAQTRVEVTALWDAARLELRIRDDGPGFEPGLLARLGEPYVSSGESGRPDSGPHMGLGIFIAQTLLSHSGAELSFTNHDLGGAEVVISWPLSQFVAGG